MQKIWGNYSETVFRNCTRPDTDEDTIAYWKNNLFATAVLYLIPLSFIAIIPGMYMALATELYLLFFVDLAAIIAFAVIAFLPGLTIQARKIIFCISIYGVSLALLYTLGSFGPGLLYLLALSIFIVLILDEIYGIVNVYLNIAICALFGVLIEFDLGSSAFTTEYTLAQWFAVSVNLIFLSAVSALLIPKLFNGLEVSFSKRREAENKLQDSVKMLEMKNQELEDFAYTASHDLKEPLRMVRSFSELLKKRQEKNLDQKSLQYIHFIVDGARRMNQLVEDLLEYSRVGRLHLEKEIVDLNKIVDEIRENYQGEQSQLKPVITSEKLPEMEVVPISIKLLFQNLIGNGIKYQDGQHTPEIQISCQENGTHWNFRVKDNGIGIPENYYDQIFQIFKRLHSNDEFRGSGIGLAICKKVVEQHGGEIWVESEASKGSSFYFSLKKS
ncbi:MAG: hypothetical protein EA359_01930 [Balneolaceae bacterium]|nr:MAG: hypothetical protein EA359_01930 [Balneolaceae bacterium]